MLVCGSKLSRCFFVRRDSLWGCGRLPSQILVIEPMPIEGGTSNSFTGSTKMNAKSHREGRFGPMRQYICDPSSWPFVFLYVSIVKIRRRCDRAVNGFIGWRHVNSNRSLWAKPSFGACTCARSMKTKTINCVRIKQYIYQPTTPPDSFSCFIIS